MIADATPPRLRSHVHHARRMAADRYARAARNPVMGLAGAARCRALTMCGSWRSLPVSRLHPHGRAGLRGARLRASMRDRLENYRKMQRELDYLERKTDKRLMSETRARWKIDP